MRFSRLRTVVAAVLSVNGVVLTHAALAQTTLPGFTNSTYATGINSPTAMAFAPDGRLFVAEQTGALRVVTNGVTASTPFATLGVDSSGERGLLGVTFDPNFGSNNYVYVYHTVVDGTSRYNQVTRYTANGDTAVAGSAVNILTLDPLSGATNHNGGSIHFGGDGKLYIGVGDNANRANSQSLSTRLGKILRINADGTIPTDNPFYNSATGDNRSIFAMGVRNPFTFGVQPGTGTIYINDVGENTWEEINVLSAGANYGWGSNGAANEGPFDPVANPGYTAPLVSYLHGGGTSQGFSIAGGAFYNPAVNSFGAAYVGDYFYADYVNGWIRGVDAGTSDTYLFASGLGNITDLTVGNDGALYYTNHSNGTIGRISGPVVVPEAGTLALVLPSLTVGLYFIRRKQQ